MQSEKEDLKKQLTPEPEDPNSFKFPTTFNEFSEMMVGFSTATHTATRTATNIAAHQISDHLQ